MIWKIAATISIFSFVVGTLVSSTNRPYPWNDEWKDVVVGIMGLAFWASLTTALVSLIWSVF